MARPKTNKLKAEAPLVQARIDEVLQLRLDGARRWDVCQYVSEKEGEAGSNWALAEGGKPMCGRQIERYISRADQIIQESHAEKRETLFARHIAQRRNIFAKAILAGDNSTALAVLKDEAALFDLYPTKKPGDATAVIPIQVIVDVVQVAAPLRAEALPAHRANGALPPLPR